jgi:predicted RNA-binding Zn-ribbon protein involved in translation (DUF1610 family)
VSDKESILNVTVDAEDARALHRVVRAMHDGHCPNCGELSKSDEMWKQGWKCECPKCGFYVTHEEAKAALDAFHGYMLKCRDVFIKHFGERA